MHGNEVVKGYLHGPPRTRPDQRGWTTNVVGSPTYANTVWVKAIKFRTELN